MIINNYKDYINIESFNNKLINNIKKEQLKYSESGDGNILNIFKKYKSDIKEEDIELFIKTFPKYNKYDTIEKLYNYFESNLDIKHIFEIFISSNNYIEYIKSDIFKDDLYILPIIQNILPDFSELNIIFIVFEDINGDIRIKVPLDKFKNSETENYIFIYKSDEIYEPIYFRTIDGYNPLIFPNIFFA